MSVSAHDVAAYILNKTGAITTMKLQKLLYYCQAWSLVWDEEPLFREEIQAWANGPVIREIYERHRGKFKVSSWRGDPEKLNKDQRETIEAVLEHYGDKSSQYLSDLTHFEDPWQKSRQGIPMGVRGNRTITHADMFEYYSSL